MWRSKINYLIVENSYEWIYVDVKWYKYICICNQSSECHHKIINWFNIILNLFRKYLISFSKSLFFFSIIMWWKYSVLILTSNGQIDFGCVKIILESFTQSKDFYWLSQLNTSENSRHGSLGALISTENLNAVGK